MKKLDSLEQIRDGFQAMVDLLNEGIEIDKREKAGEKISEEESDAWLDKFMLGMIKLQRLM